MTKQQPIGACIPHTFDELWDNLSEEQKIKFALYLEGIEFEEDSPYPNPDWTKEGKMPKEALKEMLEYGVLKGE